MLLYVEFKIIHKDSEDETFYKDISGSDIHLGDTLKFLDEPINKPPNSDRVERIFKVVGREIFCGRIKGEPLRKIDEITILLKEI